MTMTNVYTGGNGTLTLAFDDTPEGSDAQAIIELYETMTVGRVTGVEVCVKTDLEAFHEIGRRHPTSLHPGNIWISGSVDRAYINGSLLWLLLGRGASANRVSEPYVQPTFNMTVTLNDPAVPGNSASLELKGVKFQNWAYSMPEDDFVMENITFQALTVSVLDRESPPDGGEAVAQSPGSFSESATA